MTSKEDNATITAMMGVSSGKKKERRFWVVLEMATPWILKHLHSMVG